jgi:hypothetical protein
MSVSERVITVGEIERHYLPLDAVVCCLYRCPNGERHLLVSENLRDEVESGRIVVEMLKQISGY